MAKDQNDSALDDEVDYYGLVESSDQTLPDMNATTFSEILLNQIGKRLESEERRIQDRAYYNDFILHAIRLVNGEEPGLVEEVPDDEKIKLKDVPYLFADFGATIGSDPVDLDQLPTITEQDYFSMFETVTGAELTPELAERFNSFLVSSRYSETSTSDPRERFNAICQSMLEISGVENQVTKEDIEVAIQNYVSSEEPNEIINYDSQPTGIEPVKANRALATVFKVGTYVTVAGVVGSVMGVPALRTGLLQYLRDLMIPQSESSLVELEVQIPDYQYLVEKEYVIDGFLNSSHAGKILPPELPEVTEKITTVLSREYGFTHQPDGVWEPSYDLLNLKLIEQKLFQLGDKRFRDWMLDQTRIVPTELKVLYELAVDVLKN